MESEINEMQLETIYDDPVAALMSIAPVLAQTDANDDTLIEWLNTTA
jgi:hypothetical protein